MMHAMLARSVEDVLERTQLGYSLGMYPILIESVVLGVDEVQAWREEESQWQVVHPLKERMNSYLGGIVILHFFKMGTTESYLIA